MKPIFLTLLAVAHAAAQAIPAFPGAEGYGGYAKGGRGGDVYIVTNLNASGAGSFRNGIETIPAAGRTIVFAVSGHIHINGLRLTGSKVTIAGQTAPGDGVGLVDGTFRISSDDVVVRHLRFRHRKSGSGGDCINLDSGSINSVLDSLSMQFSTDENFSSFGSPPENLTMQWSVNAWGLESHSCGGLWDQNHATCHHSLWAHNHTRNPKARPGGLLEWTNNVTFDWDIGFIMGDSATPASWKSNVRNSYFLCPPGNPRSKALEKANLDRNGVPNFSLYLNNCRHDSDGDGLLNGTDKGYGIASGSYTTLAAPAPNTGAIPVTMDDPVVAFKKIVSKSGALRLDIDPARPLRDEVDTKLIQNLVTQTANHISSESQLGVSNGGIGTLVSTAAPVDTDKDGMPDFYESSVGWNPAVQDHNTALANSAGVVTGTTFLPANTPVGAGVLEKYTRLEEYLHFLAIAHGTVAKNVVETPTNVVVDLRKFTSGFSATPVFTVAAVSNGSIVQSGVGNCIVTFTPTQNFVGRARFDFTVTDAAGHSWTQTCALVVTSAGLPRDLQWQGGQSANAWDTVAANWLRGSTPTAFGGNDRVSFTDSGSQTPAVNVTGTFTPGSVDVVSNGNYTFGGVGAIASSGPLAKRGTGSLTISNTGPNSFTAATLEAGTLNLNVFNAIGSAPLAISGGTLNLGASLSSPLAIGGAVAINSTGTTRESTGAWSGSGPVALNIGSTTFSLRGSTSAFAGSISLGSSSGFFRLYGSLGSPLASFDLGSGTADLLNRDGNVTIELGSLAGGSGTTLAGAGSLNNPTTYRIGANGASTTFSGAIANGMGITNIVKIGTGALTLNGTGSHTGNTTVSAGELVVNGLLGPTATTVAGGARLRGNGVIGGPVTAQLGAEIAPGAVGGQPATLGVGAGLALQGATLALELSSNPATGNDKLSMNGGTLALTGVNPLVISLSDGQLGAGTYQLISGGSATTGGLVNLSHNLPANSRQGFALATTTPGAVQLVVTGSAVSLLWKGNASGTWDVNTTTNWLNGAVAEKFFDFDATLFDDTATSRSVTLAAVLSPRSLVVDTALGYTFGGGGSLGGGATLVKLGGGVLNFTNTAPHTFSGGLTLHAGTIALGNDTTSLGSGPVTLLGGTVSMNDDATSYNSFTAAFIVPAAATARLNADSRVDLYGTLAGAGTLQLRVPFSRTTLFGDWSDFTGRIELLTDADGGDFRMGTAYAFPGFPQAALALADRVSLSYIGTLSQGAGTTIDLGEISGAGLSRILGGPTGGRNLTYRVGGRNTDATFAGTILEQNIGTLTSYVKTGTGLWSLTGSGTWNGGTSVEQGTLEISGPFSCASAVNVLPAATLKFRGGSLATDAVNIASGAFLSGNGTITGDLNNDGTVTCLTGGTLAVTGDVVNNGLMRIAGGSTLVAGASFVNNGILDLLTGTQGLPANFENNGIVIDARSLGMTTVTKAGNVFTLTVPTHSGHVYQLQRSASLAADWADVGAPQDGLTGSAGSPSNRTFTDPAASGPRYFYRVEVIP